MTYLTKYIYFTSLSLFFCNMDKTFLRFKGSIMGALLGDCLGAPFEAAWKPVSLKQLKDLIKEVEKIKPSKDDSFFLNYTDDTEMAHVLMQSYIEKKTFHPLDVAKKWSQKYFEYTGPRAYGCNVPQVFVKLKAYNYECDPYQPGSEQFDGSGSYGNGSGMRVFPVGLVCHSDMEKLKEMAKHSARITHSHIEAINGAILQAAAVSIALSAQSNLTWREMWDQLDKVCREIEDQQNGPGIYASKLQHMKDFLQNDTKFKSKDVVEKIGVGIKATEAISAAIFAFLCCLAKRQPKEFAYLPLFERSVFYAISLGGDTDTIGTMTGAIAGAFCGAEAVPQKWLCTCEGYKVAEELADSLYKVVKQEK